MSEPTRDVIVKPGTANVSNPWRIPGVRRVLDFAQSAEFTLPSLPVSRVHELRALGFEVLASGEAPSAAPLVNDGTAEAETPAQPANAEKPAQARRAAAKTRDNADKAEE